MQLQSLFAQQENKETLHELELNLSHIVKEISDYLEEIRDLTKLGFYFSMEENKFKYTQDSITLGTIGFVASNGILLAFLPGSGIMQLALVAGITGAGVFKYFSKESGLYKNRLDYIKKKTETFKSLLKNDKFRVALIVNIEKEFNTLEDKFKLKPDTLAMVKKKRSEMMNELKSILVEEDLSNLQRLLILLSSIKQIEEQTQKLLKLDLLNHEVNKQLNFQTTQDLEENEVTEKIKALL